MTRYLPALVVAAIGALLAWRATSLSSWGTDMSGPGLFPFGLGLLLLALGGGLAVQARLGFRVRTGEWPDAGGWLGIAKITAGVLLYAALLESWGFLAVTAALALVLLRFVWRRPWPSSLLFAVMTAVGFYTLFTVVLGVALPSGRWGF